MDTPLRPIITEMETKLLNFIESSAPRASSLNTNPLIEPNSQKINEELIGQIFAILAEREVTHRELNPSNAFPNTAAKKENQLLKNQIKISISNAVGGFQNTPLSITINVNVNVTIQKPEESKPPQAPGSITPIPPPNVPATFIVTNGDWNKPFSVHGSKLCRNIDFGSTVHNSTFSRVSLAGWTDGTLIFQVGFASDPRDEWLSIKNYLEQQGIPESIMLPHGLCTDNPELIRAIFKILIAHNQFPAEQLTLVRQVIEAEDWRTLPGQA